MPLFKYKAMSEGGKRIEGEFTANAENEVLAMIRENGYYPIIIEEKLSRKEITFSQSFTRIKAKDLAVFCRQVSTLLEAGADMLNTVNLLRKQSENKKLQNSLDQIYEDIQKGFTLSSAMRKFEYIYPSLLINMVASGEETGQLGSVFEKMAEQFERDTRINGKIKGALVYPAILSVMSIGIVIFLLTFIMPTFVDMFTGSGVELPAPTQFVINLSEGIKKYWYIIIIVIGMAAYAIRVFIRTEEGGKQFDRLKLNLPLIKSTSRKILTMRFARGLSTTLYSGLTMVNALEIVAKVIDNKLIETKLNYIREKVIKGVPLNEALESIEEFPPMLTAMVKIGEESGAIDNILDKTAKFYEQEVEEALQRLTTMIEPIMILIMGVLIGGIVIAMILPMFDMFQTVM